MTIASQPFLEHVAQLGAEGNLIGIVTDPVTSDANGARAARYVILNAGVLHRVGPHRLHVDLARRLSTDGFAGIRVDLSGIGDSRPVPGTMTFWESAVADLKVVIDEFCADSPCVVVGLCSGAHNAQAAAIADTRIRGLVLLDPPAYATRASKLRKLRRRLRDQEGPIEALRWAASAVFRRRIGARRVPRAMPGDDPDASTNSSRNDTPRDQWGSQLKALCDRGVRILCIYSGAYDERYNDAEQIWEWFPELKGRFDVWYEPDANHVFTPVHMRGRLVSKIGAWCVDNFG